MTLNEYQMRAMTTCLPTSANPLYMLFEIGEEYGELLGKFSKYIRKNKIKFDNNELLSAMNEEEFKEWRELVFKELGDIIWGVAGICEVLGTNLETIAEMNNEKLSSRQDRGKIDGSGDNR